MSLDAESIKKIAFLARLKIPESEVEILQKELNQIIEWIEQLSEVETENVAPMTSVADMKLFERDDNLSSDQKREDILSNASENNGPYFSVPKVVE